MSTAINSSDVLIRVRKVWLGSPRARFIVYTALAGEGRAAKTGQSSTTAWDAAKDAADKFFGGYVHPRALEGGNVDGKLFAARRPRAAKASRGAS